MVSAGTLIALGLRSGGGAVVDFAGALAFGPTFAADVVDIHDFISDLAPSVAFGADLTVTSAAANYVDFIGNLGGISHYGRLKYGLGHYSRIDAFQPILAGDFDTVGQPFFAGDMAPQVALGASLTFETSLDGGFAFTVLFEVSGLISGPLWVETEPCPPSMWTSTEPCPPTMWTPTEPCTVEWEDTELCNG